MTPLNAYPETHTDWMTMSETVAAAIAELDRHLDAIGGCTDGYCIIRKPKGMHTNGGCKCSGNRMKMTQFAYAHNRFVDAVRGCVA